jgi:NAD(P)-dependent dehydrogenase (short-subunit alcohol dehydrogenase family)
MPEQEDVGIGMATAVAAPEIENVTWNFQGKIAMVTGAGNGMGREISLSLARAGADLVLVDIGHNVDTVPYQLSTNDDLTRVAEECRAAGVKVTPVLCDVRDVDGVKAAVDEVVGQLGRLDILICSHGVNSPSLVADMSEQTWDVMLETNLKGVFSLTRAVVPHMIAGRSGKIVAIGSTLSYLGFPYAAHYSAAKHGVVGYAKSLALEVARYGINVNVVCPGAVGGTGMFTGLIANKQPEYVAEHDRLGPFNMFDNGEAIHPGDIAQGVLFLASDAARYITGTSLIIDQASSAK